MIRWDGEQNEKLSAGMNICLQTLYDTIKNIASEIEDVYGWNSVSPHLQKAVYSRSKTRVNYRVVVMVEL